MSFGLPPPRAWIWCWLSGTGAHGFGLSCSAPGPLGSLWAASGQPLQPRADTLAHARRPVAQWHHLQPAGEVDQALALKPRPHLPLPGPRD
ncbi:hypothetical protein GH733_007755 [Mirounga leonina]|nr:hypothetical protein GH733_007755 [Mirounga leonina]